MPTVYSHAARFKINLRGMVENTEQSRTLALVGMPGAGKTVCAEYLAERGYWTLRFGGLVVDEVRRRGWLVNAENERVVREDMRDRHGMAAMAALSLPRLQAALAEKRNIVIDGLYSFSEYQLLRRELGAPLLLLAIVAPRHLRYQRLANRPVRPLNAEQALQRDTREIERLEKGGPIAMADYTLLNAGGAAQLLAQLDALLERLDFLP
ncbi:MAG: AAA family ATPase [Chloroflexi bacterium]|nr:AAA family ATPase [Chloroflexota bacterium]MCY4248742.1 AAA family ATPase [Chloroflexota bacterium]